MDITHNAYPFAKRFVRGNGSTYSHLVTALLINRMDNNIFDILCKKYHIYSNINT